MTPLSFQSFAGWWDFIAEIRKSNDRKENPILIFTEHVLRPVLVWFIQLRDSYVFSTHSLLHQQQHPLDTACVYRSESFLMLNPRIHALDVQHIHTKFHPRQIQTDRPQSRSGVSAVTRILEEPLPQPYKPF